MNKKVLIIDDELDIIEGLEFRFKKAGFSVVCARDGKEGLLKAQQEKPDLVILDLMLPEIPGEEVCKEIRKDERIAKIPIIMLTVKSSDADKIVGMVVGADCYVTKPFEITDLLKEVYRLIGNPQDQQR